MTKTKSDHEITQKLTALKQQYHQLIHCSNILQKIKKEQKQNLEAILALGAKYIDYIEKNLSLNGWSNDVINQRVDWLNEYYEFYDKSHFNYCSVFSSQGKLRSTILEEFVFLLFKDYFGALKNKFNDVDNVLGIGAASAYTNLYFSPADIGSFVKNPSVKVNIKDQDFALYRAISILCGSENNRQEIKAKVPFFATEVKTYVDKTMLEGMIATAEKLKMGNPYSRFVVLTEHYDVDKSIDPSYSQIDQIYILRKDSSRKDVNKMKIQANVVIKYFTEAINHINRPWSDINTKIQQDGVII